MRNKVHHGGNIEKVAEALGVSVEEIRDFSANINPLGFPQELQTIFSQGPMIATVYPDPTYAALKQAIANQFAVNPGDVFVGNGATEVLDEAICAGQASNALILAPTFGEYERLFKRQGTKVHYYLLKEENNFAYKTDSMINFLVEHPEITTICLTNPNNPTGQLVSLSEMRKLVDFCNGHRRLLILDESFIDLTVNQQLSFVNALQPEDHVYVIRAATKFFAIPGLRLGYCITKNPALKKNLHAQEDTWSVNALADAFGRKMFHARDYINRTHAWLNEQQPILKKKLQGLMGIKVFPSMTNFFLFKTDCPNLREQMMHKLVMIRQCDDYVGLGSDYYRVAVKSAEDNAYLIWALKEVVGSDK